MHYVITLAAHTRYVLSAFAFEFIKTFVWFTVLPFGFFTEAIRRPYQSDEAFNYNISIYQYYFLPLVGILKYLCAILFASVIIFLTKEPLYGAFIGAVTYLIISGGIHLDGWIDTVDAMYAYGKDRYRIIREPHVGALGVIWLSFYLMLFVSTLTFVMYDIFTSIAAGPKILALSVSFLASKINCFYILQYALHNNKMIQDDSMTLKPLYYFHNTPITHWITYVLIYGSIALCIFIGLYLLSPEDAPWLVTWFVLIFIFTVSLNQLLTKPVIKELNFCNGDVFGALICLFELVYLILYTLLFVRAERHLNCVIG